MEEKSQKAAATIFDTAHAENLAARMNAGEEPDDPEAWSYRAVPTPNGKRSRVEARSNDGEIFYL